MKVLLNVIVVLSPVKSGNCTFTESGSRPQFYDLIILLIHYQKNLIHLSNYILISSHDDMGSAFVMHYFAETHLFSQAYFGPLALCQRCRVIL